MAHRHDEQRAVVAVQAEFDLGDERQHRAASMISCCALRGPSRSRRVHQRPWVFRRHRAVWLTVARDAHYVLVGDKPGWALTFSKPNSARGLNRKLWSNFLQGSDKFVLHDDGCGLGVVHDVAKVLADQAEVERDGD